MLQNLLLFKTILNDAPQPWQIGFQDSAAPGFTGIVELHNTIFFYLILICVGVFWMLGSIMYFYNSKKSPIVHKYLNHGSNVPFYLFSREAYLKFVSAEYCPKEKIFYIWPLRNFNLTNSTNKLFNNNKNRKLIYINKWKTENLNPLLNNSNSFLRILSFPVNSGLKIKHKRYYSIINSELSSLLELEDRKNNATKELNIASAAKYYENAEVNKSQIFSENKNKSGIYKWTNKITGDFYIGQSRNLSQRIKNYYSHYNLNKYSQFIIHRALLKYGHTNFALEILEYCDISLLTEREQYYFDTLNPAYNILKTATVSASLKEKFIRGFQS